ncbi:MAG: dihydroorotate dehydrogenase electron transfer subunit [Actinobacteria bacterium]|nr:dihydroorotate dehydrogenase electron transfer subunit [Actinomycetota bacterium]
MRRVRAEILSTRRLGAYHVLTLVAPEIADRARPGQFLAVGMPAGREFVLRRHFSIHQASRRGGWAGTLEFAIGADGPGTEWLAQAVAHEFLDVIGPLGKAFAYPKQLTNCLLIAEGHGAASLYFLAQELKARHKRVDMIVGAEDLERVFKPIEGKRLSQAITIMTADGSAGERGVALDALPDMVERCGTEVIYAAASVRTLERIAAFCRERKIPAQVAVEEAFGCGVGLCFSCVVPVARKDGTGYDNLRACVDGPVMNPARVLWDRWLSEEPRMIPTPPEGLPVVRSWPG